MKRPTLPMMPFFPRDYLAATRHMTLAERGAYTDLLFQSWDSGKPLPKDPTRLAAMLGCAPKEFTRVWPAIREKLTETAEGYVSHRLESERTKAVARASKAQEKAADAANARWNATRTALSNALSNALSMPGAVLKDCPPYPSPSASKDPDPERARPAVLKGQRARLSKGIDEDDPEVQRRRAAAVAIAGKATQ